MKNIDNKTIINADLVNKIFTQIDAKEIPEILFEISELLSAVNFAVYQAPPDQDRFTSVVSGVIDEHLHRDYLDYYQNHDIQIKRLVSYSKRELITGVDLTTRNEIKKCPVHNEYLIPNRIDTQLVFYSRSKLGYKRTFVAMRDRKQGAFNSVEIELFKKISYYLKNSFELHDANKQLIELTQITDTINKQLKNGIALLDVNNRIMYMNKTFKELVHRLGFLVIRDGTLCANEKFHNPLKKVLNNTLCDQVKSVFFNSKNIRVKFKAIPYANPPNNHNLFISDACYLLCIQQLPESKVFKEKTIQEYLKITPAESRLAVHLANCGLISDYVVKWGISKHTARNQLKSIFNKTGIGTQKELIAKIFDTDLS